jgi:hypothetical protein
MHNTLILCPFLVVLKPAFKKRYEGRMRSLWLYEENNKLWDLKNIITLHITP